MTEKKAEQVEPIASPEGTTNIDKLVKTNRTAVYWAGIFLFVMVMLCVQSFLIMKTVRQKQRVVVTDAAYDVHITKVQDFQDSTDLIFYISRMAAYARLDRNEEGVTNTMLFEQLFLPRALRKAKRELEQDKPFFKERMISQECIIEELPIIRKSGSNDVFVRLYGRLLRRGVFREREFVQYLDFKLELHLKRNPYLRRQGRLPLAVYNYRFKTRLHKQLSSLPPPNRNLL